MNSITIDVPNIDNLPDLVLTAAGNVSAAQLVTAANVRYVLDQTGFDARLNMMTGQVTYQHREHVIATDPAAQGQTEIAVLDMCTRMRMKSRETVREIITVLALADPYHPMEDWLKALPPAGGDPVGDLIDAVTTDNPLWPVYVENWLTQTVEGVCGWRNRQDKKSLPHVLVLAGGQGAGKSHLLKQIGGEWFKGEAELHLGASSGKDHQIEALKYPMVELAELDGIFRKADVSHMKSFISREEDSIRAAYERRALVRPRMTSFCGSVNDAEFLNDNTGSRRFWPVMVEDIDWGYVCDREALWAAAYAMWLENPSFNLTAEDDAERARIATAEHLMESATSELVREYMRVHRGNPQYPEQAMSTLDVLTMLYGSGHGFSNKDKADASLVLRDILGKNRTISGKQRAWLIPFNGLARQTQNWPDKISHVSGVCDAPKPSNGAA